MADSVSYLWPQGEDLTIKLIYKEGEEGSEVLIPLGSGYEVRMDIISPKDKQRVYTFNSAELADVDPIASGAQPDNVVEAVLSNTSPNINITVPRSLTLPGGPIYAKFTETPSVATFMFDVFLRNTVSNKQWKIVKNGTITIEGSYTLWP